MESFVFDMERLHFKELAAGNVNDEGPVEMESLCMDCEKNVSSNIRRYGCRYNQSFSR